MSKITLPTDVPQPSWYPKTIKWRRKTVPIVPLRQALRTANKLDSNQVCPIRDSSNRNIPEGFIGHSIQWALKPLANHAFDPVLPALNIFVHSYVLGRDGNWYAVNICMPNESDNHPDWYTN